MAIGRTSTRRRLRLRDARWWAFPFAAIYAVTFLVNLPYYLGQTYLGSDAAAAPVIGELIGKAPPDRIVSLATNPWYESLWFMQLTHGLPAHRQIWELAPIAFWILAAALVVWMAARAIGRWEAALVGVLVLCAGGSLYAETVLNTHGPAVVHSCVLGATLLWWTAGAAHRRGPLVASAVVLAAFTVLGVATDVLLVISGIVPFVGAAAFAWWRVRTPLLARIAVASAAVSAISLAGGAALAAYMRDDQHVIATGLRPVFVTGGQLVSTTTKFLEDFGTVGNGGFFGRSADVRATLMLASALLVFAALALVLRWAPRWVRAAGVAADPVRTVYVAFWSLTIVTVVAAYLVTTVALTSGGTSRYLVSPFWAVAALLPLALLGKRVLLSGAVAVFAALACIWLIDYFNQEPDPMQVTWGQVAGYARDHGLKYGYAGYWDAASLTWESKMSVEVYPVWACRLPAATLCPFRGSLHTISTWYRPRPATPSFVLTHPSVTEGFAQPDPAFGKPRAVVGFPNDVTMYVYGHDVAAQFQPNR